MGLKVFKTVITLLLVLSINNVFGWINIDSTRQIQLDSIITNTPKEKLKTLSLLHQYIHENGRNDEERVWMFYGYFGIHTKYDHARKYDKKALYQSPEYTVYKRKGVCRDFSQVFLKFCELSEIPCIEITGEVPKTVVGVLSDLVHLNIPNVGHAWNVVKLNGEWLFMDPTWSSVKSVKRYYEIDKDGKKKYIAKCKIPDRTYYDGIPQNMVRNHKPNHPAFLLLDDVPEWKFCFKKDSRKKYFAKSYDYNTVLDSLYATQYPQMSPEWFMLSRSYSGKDNSNYIETNLLNYHRRKVPKVMKPDLQDYYCHFELLDSVVVYLHKNYDYSIGADVNSYKVMLDTSFVMKLEEKTYNSVKEKSR